MDICRCRQRHHNRGEVAQVNAERFFASPFVARCALNVVVALAIVMVVMVGYGASHRRDVPETRIHECALVLTREGHSCR